MKFIQAFKKGDSFPFTHQSESMDCGAACLHMILNYYGKKISLTEVKKHANISPDGMTLKDLGVTAEYLGLNTNGVRLPYLGNDKEAGLIDVNLPTIVHWNDDHYVVVYKLSKTHVWLANPSLGKRKVTKEKFERHWIKDGHQGIALLLEPNVFFNKTSRDEKSIDGTLIFGYLKQYWSHLLGICLILLINLGIVFSIPFITKALFDEGIAMQNTELIVMLSVAQLLLYSSMGIFGFFKNWIGLEIGVGLNIKLSNRFLKTMLGLPISFYDRKSDAELLKSIYDNTRISSFYSSTILEFVFTVISFLAFSFILWYFNTSIFLIVLTGVFIYLLLFRVFYKKREEVDMETFKLNWLNDGKLLELVNGIQELKLNNSENKRRWQWLNIQNKLFKKRLKSLFISESLNQSTSFVIKLTSISATLVASIAVIKSSLTIGELFSIQYILGQVIGSLGRLVPSLQNIQDALISNKRLSTIYSENAEDSGVSSETISIASSSIFLDRVSFSYPGQNGLALNQVSLTVLKGKLTAIVGDSGSGKTSLLKLILNFYEPQYGTITLADRQLSDIPKPYWRSKIGTVLQSSYIFPDTIAHNICESSPEVDVEKMIRAAKLACIDDFIQTLNDKYNTIIGPNGINLSAGQKQRLILARALYKEPDYFIMDEATNSLDTITERKILENLRCLENKTFLFVAHRLNTIKEADQIVVMDKGKVVETGSHESLMSLRSKYFALVQSQSQKREHETL